MAKTPNGDWTQPVTFIPVATEKRGHFQRMPEMPVLATIAAEYGNEVAGLWCDAMRQYALRTAQARAKGKNVADSVEAERKAASDALAEIANGSLKSRDTDPNNAIKSRPEFLAALRAHLTKRHPDVKLTDAQIESTAATHGDAFLALVGDDLAKTITYSPAKKGAGGGATEALAI